MNFVPTDAIDFKAATIAAASVYVAAMAAAAAVNAAA
jgi:hypothetical protein